MAQSIDLSWLALPVLIVAVGFFCILGLMDLLQKYDYLVPKAKRQREEAEAKWREKVEEELTYLMDEVRETKNVSSENNRFTTGILEGLNAIVLKQEDVGDRLQNKQEVCSQQVISKLDEFSRYFTKRIDSFQITRENPAVNLDGLKLVLDDIRTAMIHVRDSIATQKHQGRIEKILEIVERHDQGVNELVRLHPNDIEGPPRHFCNVSTVSPQIAHLTEVVHSVITDIDSLKRQWEGVPQDLKDLSASQKVWYDHVLQQGQETIKLFQAMVRAWEQEGGGDVS